MKRVHITFPCGEIELEGVWHFPDTPPPFPAVVVCHPHSLHGGNMSNNVVWAICQALAQGSVAALRFDFRGVRNSGGSYGEGIAEQEDVRAALAFAASTSEISPARLGLAGYSFGGAVAFPVAAASETVRLLALISPALDNSGWEQLRQYTRPLYFIHGEHDFIVTPEVVKQHLGDIPHKENYAVIPGADHFLEGHEPVIAEKLSGFFTDGFRRL